MSMKIHEPERPISPSLIDTLHGPPCLRTRTAPASFADKVPYNVMERRGTANALVRLQAAPLKIGFRVSILHTVSFRPQLQPHPAKSIGLCAPAGVEMTRTSHASTCDTADGTVLG